MTESKFSIGDCVISAPNSDYPLMIGTVEDVVSEDSPDHETENEGDDIYVDFTGPYSPEREAELLEHFNRLYAGEDRQSLDDYGFDLIIMSADELKLVDPNAAKELADAYDTKDAAEKLFEAGL